MRIDKQVVWITGASSGIGKELAKVYNTAGSFVILSARSIDKLEALQSVLPFPSQSRVLGMDMEDGTSIRAGVQVVMSSIGRVDLLINNAGISQRSITKDTTLDTYRRLMEVNFHGVVDLTKRVLEYMIKHKTGHIAVVSSIAGKLGAPQRSGYSASKHALHGFFDCLRSEVADDGIHISILCPGYARTNIDVNALNKEGKPQGKQDELNQKGMHPDRLARKMKIALDKKKQEVYFGGIEVVAVYLKRFFPGILSRILLKKNRELKKVIALF